MTAPTRLGTEPLPPSSGSILARPVPYPAMGAVETPGSERDDLTAHLARYGGRTSAGGPAGDALLARLEQSGLTGRGGAHFPVARKWRSARSAARGGVVVANGAESEPASAKDAALLQRRPHLVLDGLTSAAEFLGADVGVLFLHEQDRATRAAVAAALAERNGTGVSIQVITAPGHFLAGESSAALRAVAGGPSLPQFRRRPATIEGIGGRPTLLHNVETFARVALIDRLIPQVAARCLVTVLVDDQRVVLEALPGQTVAQVIAQARAATQMPPRGGSAPNPTRSEAILLGGYGGRWVRWDQVAATPVDERALRAVGASLGAGIVVPLPPGACGLVETARAVEYLSASRARQCGPCHFGLPAISTLMSEVARCRTSNAGVQRLLETCGEVRGRGACHHPDGVVALVASALEVFVEELARHLHGGCSFPSGRPILPIPPGGPR